MALEDQKKLGRPRTLALMSARGKHRTGVVFAMLYPKVTMSRSSSRCCEFPTPFQNEHHIADDLTLLSHQSEDERPCSRY